MCVCARMHVRVHVLWYQGVEHRPLSRLGQGSTIEMYLETYFCF